jgi:hypothetical protein
LFGVALPQIPPGLCLGPIGAEPKLRPLESTIELTFFVDEPSTDNYCFFEKIAATQVCFDELGLPPLFLKPL